MLWTVILSIRSLEVNFHCCHGTLMSAHTCTCSQHQCLTRWWWIMRTWKHWCPTSLPSHMGRVRRQKVEEVDFHCFVARCFPSASTSALVWPLMSKKWIVHRVFAVSQPKIQVIPWPLYLCILKLDDFFVFFTVSRNQDNQDLDYLAQKAMWLNSTSMFPAG